MSNRLRLRQAVTRQRRFADWSPPKDLRKDRKELFFHLSPKYLDFQAKPIWCQRLHVGRVRLP